MSFQNTTLNSSLVFQIINYFKIQIISFFKKIMLDLNLAHTRCFTSCYKLRYLALFQSRSPPVQNGYQIPTRGPNYDKWYEMETLVIVLSQWTVVIYERCNGNDGSQTIRSSLSGFPHFPKSYTYKLRWRFTSICLL